MDLLYSKKTHLFRSHCFQLLRGILQKETEIGLSSRRFQIKNTLYPLHLVIFSEKTKLGYCNADLFEIGINICLIEQAESILKDVLRHEMAHLLTFLEYGVCPDHGKEFLAICKRYNWPQSVSNASISLHEFESKEKKRSKVQKLLSLSQSGHQAEALSALRKAQELINKYALSDIQEDEEWFSRRVLHTKRLTQKLKTISSIVREFHVIPTFHSFAGGVYLELFGTRECIEQGEHVAHFLNSELEILWNAQTTLKGAREKKGFYIGVAEGFVQVLKQQERSLVQFDSMLAKAYRTYVTQGSILREKVDVDLKSKKIGQKEGKQLCIPKGASPSFIPGIQWQRDSIYNIPSDF